MTGGRITSIHNKGSTPKAKNYRPITCVLTYFNLITLILTDIIYEHLTTNEIIPYKKKGVRHKARGCKNHLLLEKVDNEDATTKR